MRAYSVRDFYAKTLALVGLGVLAGIGALLDYWPASIVLPQTTLATQAAATAAILPVPVAEPAMAPVRSQRRARPAAESTSAFAPAYLAVASLDFVPNVAVALSAPPPDAPEPPSLGVAQWAEIQLVDFAPAGPMLEASLEPPARPVNAAEGGLISTAANAFKKTGSTIASAGKKTGAKTGAAFRAVGDAIRRVLPL